MPDYDQIYQAQPGYFGAELAALLERFAQRIPAGPVLDIGVGQGRNALPLARLGHEVVGIDPSSAAISATAEVARAEGLSVTLWQGSFEDFRPERPFAAVLAFGLLQELTPERGRQLCRSITLWTMPLGLVFLIAWHDGDPRVPHLRRECRQLGPGSFRLPSGEVRTYLPANGILALFPEPAWQAIHHWEGLGPEHRHGDGPLERHGWIELCAQKAPGS